MIGSQRQRFIEYVLALRGCPYFLSGQDPDRLVDCSGMIMCGFWEVGWKLNDMSSGAMWGHFADVRVKYPHAGCLAFWGNDNAINHVEVSLGENRYGQIVFLGARKSRGCVVETVGSERGDLKLWGYVDPFQIVTAVIT